MKLRFGVFFLICGMIGMMVPSLIGAQDYAHTIEVEKIRFDWRIEKDQLHVQLKAETEGWVGIGFNPSDKMKDADFIMGYVKKGKVKVADHFGVASTQHKEDTRIGGTSDVSNAEGSEKEGFTEIRFTIPLKTEDAKDKAITPDADTTVLLAYGSGRDSFRSRHAFRSVLTVNLSTGKFTRVK